VLKKTLQNKLIVSTLLIIFLSGLFASLAVFFYTRHALVENQKKGLLAITKEQTHEINEIFILNKELIKKISQRNELQNYLREESSFQDEKILDLLNSYVLGDSYLAIYLLNKNGLTLASTDPRFTGQNYSFRNYFKKSIVGKYFLEANIGVTSKELGYYFSAPVISSNDNRGVEGVIVIKLNPKAFERAFHLNEDVKGKLMVVNGEGVILFSNFPERNLKSLGVLSKNSQEQIEQGKKFPGITITPLVYDLAQQEVEKEKNQFIFDFFDIAENTNEFMAGAEIGDTNFYLVLEVATDFLNNQAFLISCALLLFVVLSIIFCSLIIIFIISHSFYPLREIKDIAQLISLGNFQKKVNIKTGDELEELGNSINIMIDSLRDSYGNLEFKIDEKTKELAKQLEAASKKNKVLNDTQKAVVNVLEDIQQEKNISQNLAQDLLKFQLAVENASDHIIITDPDAHILYANYAAEKITGYDRKKMVGQTPALWGKQMNKDFYEKMWRSIKTEKKEFSGEIINKRQNGEKYIAESHIIPIFKKNGGLQFFVGIERDITKAKEIDKAKTEFVSLASHQLRTPLTAISWYIEMLMNGKAGKLKKDQRKYLQEVYSGSIRMRDLVNALLNVSRLEMGTFMVEPQSIKIEEVANSLIKEMHPTVLEKKIKISKSFKDLPKEFLADLNLFRIILQNILSNAIKYTPKGGSVSFDAEKKNQDILITVSDNGYGIPKNQQKNIFTKFFRADNARIKDPNGTGLGLYIVKSVLDHSGGKIWFESEEDKGTKFFVSLPLTGMRKKAGEKGLI